MPIPVKTRIPKIALFTRLGGKSAQSFPPRVGRNLTTMLPPSLLVFPSPPSEKPGLQSGLSRSHHVHVIPYTLVRMVGLAATCEGLHGPVDAVAESDGEASRPQ